MAVHVRKGTGYDQPLLSYQCFDNSTGRVVNNPCVCEAHKDYFVDKAYPVKFPPDQFYINHIKWLSEYYDNKSLYVHIFTDDPFPKVLRDQYEAAVNRQNIVWGCRENNNAHDQNVLQDLFDMAQFDCLIRSGSNFPQIAQLIGNHKMVIYPRDFEWCSYLNIYNAGCIIN